MPTHSLDLLFLTHDKRDVLPGPPIAHIYIKSHTKHEYKRHEDKILISLRCMSFPEIRDEIRRLKNELDELEKRAKTKFEASS